MNDLQTTKLERDLLELKDKHLPGVSNSVFNEVMDSLSELMTSDDEILYTQRDYIKQFVNPNILNTKSSPGYLIARIPNGHVKLHPTSMARILTAKAEIEGVESTLDDVGGKRKLYPLSFLKKAIPEILVKIMTKSEEK